MLKQLKNFFSHPIVRYYSNHPFVLIRNRLIVLWLWAKKFFGADLNFNPNTKSNIPIDVVIVAIDKDFDVLVHVIDSIRENIKHPISEIILICPESAAIKKICKDKKCRFVDETKVLPISKKDIGYFVDGKNRSGWIFQQLLKWSGSDYAKSDYFLVADADTVFCRPQVFIKDGKVLMPVCSQLGHIPYYKAFTHLTGEKVKALLNFTSHHVLFDKKRLAELKDKIEKHCKMPWYKAIISTKNINPSEGSCVSDYETYGQYFYKHYRDECRLEHWFNLSLSRKENLPKLKNLIQKYRNKYKAISFHSYKN